MLVLAWTRVAPILAIAVVVGIAASSHAQTSDDLAATNKQVEKLVKEEKYAEALPFAERASRAAEELHGADDPAVAGALLLLAEVLGHLGRFVEAGSYQQRALNIREAALGPTHRDTTEALDALTRTFARAGRPAEAEALVRRSLAIVEKALGPDHRDVGTSLRRLATLYTSQRRYADAEPLYVRSLVIYEKALGPDDPDVGAVVYELASLYEWQQRYADAASLYNRGLVIFEKNAVFDSAFLDDMREDVAWLYLRAGRYADAEPLFTRILAIREKVLGPDHPDVASTLNTLGALYNEQDRYADAEPLLWRSIAIQEKARGLDHPDLGKPLKNLGLNYLYQGRYADAEPFHVRSIEIAEKAGGPDDPEVAEALTGLALLYQFQGRHADAEPLLRRSVAIAEKVLAPDDPRFSLMGESLGAYLKSEGRLNEAEPLLKHALAARQKAQGLDHPDVIGATVTLAELYGLQGHVVEAQALFAQVRATKPVDLKELPIYFATNRKRDLKQKRVAFGSERNLGELIVGVVKVVVPPPPRPLTGQRGSGKNQGPELRTSDVRQLVMQPAELVSTDKLVRAARKRLFGTRTNIGHALVFVHGYNTSFDNAIRRAGQLAHDLYFDGPVFAFSWPARESPLSYLGARESAQLSADALREFIETVVAETNAKRIHIIAHSMGSVALNEALFTLEPATLMKLNIGEIVLASPDLDPDLFERTYRRLQKRGATSTIYASSSDLPLWFSSSLRDLPQLGYIPPEGPKRLIAGTDLIDITAVNSDIFSLNHDMYAHSPAVIGDLRRLLKEGQRPPDVRTSELAIVPAAGGVYWRYQLPVPRP